MKDDEEGIRAVRELREKVSAEFENAPGKLVRHYMMEQEKYGGRVPRPARHATRLRVSQLGFESSVVRRAVGETPSACRPEARRSKTRDATSS